MRETLGAPALCQGAVGTKARFGAYLRMFSTGLWPQFIDRATPALGIQEVTVPRAFPCNRENAVFEIEMLNEPGLAQAFGNLFGLFVFGFKRIDQVQKNQIGHLDF